MNGPFPARTSVSPQKRKLCACTFAAVEIFRYLLDASLEWGNGQRKVVFLSNSAIFNYCALVRIHAEEKPITSFESWVLLSFVELLMQQF